MEKTSKYYICPHCLGRFPYTNIWFKCDLLTTKSQNKHQSWVEKLSKPSKCKKIKKEMYFDCGDIDNNILQDKIIEDCNMGHFKYLGKIKGNKIPHRTNCYFCGDKHVYTHVCPNPQCRAELNINPHEHQYIINLAGMKSSGKSVYLGALLYMVKHHLCNITANWVIEEYQGEAQRLYEEFLNSPIDQTLVTTDIQTKPVVISFKKGLQETYSFIFYDVSGELFTGEYSIREIHEKANQFSYPDYIMLFCDPVNIHSLRKQILEGSDYDANVKEFFKNRHITEEALSHLPSNAAFTLKLREFIFYLWRSFKEDEDELSSEHLRGVLNAPVAVCLTMLDQLVKVLDPDNENYLFLKESNLVEDHNCTYFNETLNRRSNALRSQLISWKEEPFVNAVDKNFVTSTYFALSSCGIDKKLHDSVNMQPINVLDPFVWIISQVNPEMLENHNNINSTAYPTYEDEDF